MKKIICFFISALLLLSCSTINVKSLNAAQNVKISIMVIKASNNGNAVDPALTHLSSQLGQLNYSSYSLVKENSKQGELGGEISFSLPDGDALNINLKGIEDSFVTLDVAMSKAGMRTNFKIVNGGTVLIGGNEFKDGTLVIAITASY